MVFLVMLTLTVTLSTTILNEPYQVENRTLGAPGDCSPDHIFTEPAASATVKQELTFQT